jgi:hypothetical protein
MREFLRDTSEGTVVLGTGEPTGPDGCVTIEVTPAVPGGLVRAYELNVSYTSPGRACEGS